MKAIIKTRKNSKEFKVISMNNRDKKLKLENGKWYKREELFLIKESGGARNKKVKDSLEICGQKVNMDNVKTNLYIKGLEEKVERLDKENQELYNENKILKESEKNALLSRNKFLDLYCIESGDKSIYQILFYITSLIAVILGLY